MINLVINGYLNNYGFCCKKKKLNIKVILALKTYFNVIPILQYQDPDKIISFDVFYEDNNYIVLPKFSVNIKIKLKLADNIKIDNIQYSSISFNIYKYSYKKSISNFNFTGSLRDHQKLIVNLSANTLPLNVLYLLVYIIYWNIHK